MLKYVPDCKVLNMMASLSKRSKQPQIIQVSLKFRLHASRILECVPDIKVLTYILCNILAFRKKRKITSYEARVNAIIINHEFEFSFLETYVCVYKIQCI